MKPEFLSDAADRHGWILIH